MLEKVRVETARFSVRAHRRPGRRAEDGQPGERGPTEPGPTESGRGVPPSSRGSGTGRREEEPLGTPEDENRFRRVLPSDPSSQSGGLRGAGRAEAQAKVPVQPPRRNRLEIGPRLRSERDEFSV